jgi:hypothetical protein
VSQHFSAADVIAIRVFAAILVLCLGAWAVECWLKRRPRNRRIGRHNARLLTRPIKPDTWCGAIPRQPRFYVRHWTAAVGRAYRS